MKLGPEHQETIGTIVARVAALIASWLGSIALADVQAWMSLASAGAIFVYTVMQIRVLRRREREEEAKRNQK